MPPNFVTRFLLLSVHDREDGSASPATTQAQFGATFNDAVGSVAMSMRATVPFAVGSIVRKIGTSTFVSQ